MVERGGPWALATRDGGPMVISDHRAVLDCGCAVYTGLRVDNQEAATVAKECSPQHVELMRRFNAAFQASLQDPQARAAVQVADEILQDVAA